MMSSPNNLRENKNPNGKKENSKNTTFRIALLGILLAIAIAVSFIEAILPPLIPAMPYVKIGFANIILLSVLLLFGYPQCLAILIIKCVLVSVFIGNPFSLVYSLPAGFIAYSVIALLLKCEKLSITAISATSSIIHNFVQLVVASFVLGNSIWYITPYLLLLGGLAGTSTGIITFLLLKFLPIKYLSRFQIKENK